MKYSCYIFDLDGTLLYTLEDLANSVNYAMEQNHYPIHTLEEVRNMVGNGVKVLIERAVPSGTSEDDTLRTLSIFQKHYLIHNEDTTKPYDGIIDMLKALKNAGKKVAVVSNKFDKATKALCEKYFPGLIDIAVGENEAAGIRKKPYPDMVVEVMRKLNVSQEESVYIGDSEVDIDTAHNSSLPCITVLWGFREKEFLTEKGATCFVSSPLEISDIR
ncbi:MAG: HAD-IIIA family hydrolase [Prevotella sp.]|nr:HAD-IIIA family hydrolase [Prevotella sp.]MDY3964584.1 HAD-IIIA family hydrolase [Prevotella sp.]